MSSKRESMWDRRWPSRELLIRIPISTVNIVGTVASASDNTKLGLMSMLLYKGSRMRQFLSARIRWERRSLIRELTSPSCELWMWKLIVAVNFVGALAR